MNLWTSKTESIINEKNGGLSNYLDELDSELDIIVELIRSERSDITKLDKWAL